MDSNYTSRQRQFDEYLRDGITAAKSGQRKLAQSLLERAIYLQPNDARPYIWLSATTDDVNEQIELLEKAVAVEPGNASARRGLALLTGKIDRQKVIPEGQDAASAAPAADVEATGRAFLCPKCGGRLSFDVGQAALACEYCGYRETAAPASIGAETAEQVMDFYMHTAQGHRWAAAQQQFKCERCGALHVLPPGQRAVECSYCGSNQLVQSPENAELIEPQVIAVMELDQKAVAGIANHWLGKGLFSPDSLAKSGSSLRLRPAYYSCWTFDGTAELRWTCEVADGSGNGKRWLSQNGVEMRFFNDILVSGVKSLSTRDLDRLEPFNLHDLKEFKPEYLAGWPAILYDCSLSDASLVGREKVLHKLRPDVYNLIEPGREKRSISISAGSWSGMTFKHLLLPLWIGSYQFEGKNYRLLINGQTGKVSGEKPRDNFKSLMVGAIVVLILALAVLIFWAYSRGAGF